MDWAYGQVMMGQCWIWHYGMGYDGRIMDRMGYDPKEMASIRDKFRRNIMGCTKRKWAMIRWKKMFRIV